MKRTFMRLALGAFSVVAFGNGVWTLAKQTPIYLIRCKQAERHCNSRPTCGVEPYNGVGGCQEGLDGTFVPMNFECCCCTDGWQSRYWVTP